MESELNDVFAIVTGVVDDYLSIVPAGADIAADNAAAAKATTANATASNAANAYLVCCCVPDGVRGGDPGRVDGAGQRTGIDQAHPGEISRIPTGAPARCSR